MFKKTMIAVAAAAALTLGMGSSATTSSAGSFNLYLAPPPVYPSYGGHYQPNYYGGYTRRCRWVRRWRRVRRCWWSYGHRRCRWVRRRHRVKIC